MAQLGRYQEFRKTLQSHLMVLDGSMGALLMRRGLPPGYAPDLWNLEKPDVIEQVHRDYAEAGADILITNTFGASKLRLSEYNAYTKLKEINQRAVEIARRGAKGKCFIAGDIGPSGETIYPTGTLPFDQAFEIFSEQAKVLIQSGVDAIIVETMFDSLEFKAALSAIRSISPSVPILAFMTFNTDTFSDTGISPESCVAIAEGFHADLVGANCSVGPEAMLKVIERMRSVSNLPLGSQPNAGMPILKNGETIFPLDAVGMSDYIEKFFHAGVRVLGGCCGTTPDYIRNIKHSVSSRGKELFPHSQVQEKARVLLSSKSKTVSIGADSPFVMIGEKINPTGRKKVADLIREKNIEALMNDAFKQLEAGANCLDINVGVPLIDEPKMMADVVTAIQNAVEIPLVIDSSYSSALLTGANVYYGRPLLNSINAEDEKLEEVIPIAQRTGGALLALTTETEVPEAAEGRLKYARKILDKLLAAGFTRNDVIFDVLSLTVSAMRKGSIESLRTIELITKELGCATTFGLSNSSFGLPNRKFVHQAYLMMAIQRGLNSAIMNVLEPQIGTRVAAAQLFGSRPAAVEDFLRDWSEPIQEENSPNKPTKETEAKGDNPTHNLSLDETQQEIFWDIVDGKKDKITPDIEKFLATRSDEAFDLFIKVMTPGIRHLGDLFGRRKRFIPHLVAAAETMKRGVAILEPHFKRTEADKNAGTIVFATVKGDIHDIGKNICVMMLKNFGYNVIDLGRNVPMEEIFGAAKKEQASIIALSALMTTTMVQMKLLVEENKKHGFQFKIMVGGAPVTTEFAKEIGADGHCEDVGRIVNETERVFQALGYQQL
ncbi:MAG TPA: homocysteine S-methyltransferase family protein [Bdellovibrionota bacterium]|nr:homocysteine S-methyltransferase family protein [Bdellovibrionota bacterium]